MSAPITQLFRDAIQILRPTDPGIMRLQQDSPEMRNAVLLLLVRKDRLVIIATGWLHLALGALEELLDVVGAHVEGLSRTLGEVAAVVG